MTHSAPASTRHPQTFSSWTGSGKVRPSGHGSPEDAVLLRADKAIRENPYLLGRHLRVEGGAGHVALTGTVSTYFQKQMAQETLRRVEGVQKIDNLLEVNWL